MHIDRVSGNFLEGMCIHNKNQLCSSTTLNDAIHGFRQGRGMGTSTLEAKLAQQLAGMCHDPLLQVLLDVSKAYNYLDRQRCMEILRGYDLGPNLQRLLKSFWDEQVVVTKVGRLYGRPFRMERGVNQGDP